MSQPSSLLLLPLECAADPALAAGVIARMATAVAVGCLPLLPLVPVRIRAALALGFAVAAWPSAALARESAGAAVSTAPLPVVVGEACVGLGLGLVAAAVLAAAGWAGSILGSVAGLSWAEDFGPEDGSDTEGVGRLTWWLGLAAFFGAGGHLAVVAGLVDSVRVLPIGTAFGTSSLPGGPLAAIVTTLPALGLSLALALAGPALAAVVAFHVSAAICLRTIRFAPGQGMLQAASTLVLIGGLVVGMEAWIGGFGNAARSQIEDHLTVHHAHPPEPRGETAAPLRSR